MPILYIFFKICGGRVVKMRQNIPFWPPVMLCHCAVAWGCRLPREGGQRCVEVSISLGNVWQVRRDFWGLKWTRSLHFQGKWGNRDRMFRGRNLEGMSASGQGIHPRERPGWAGSITSCSPVHTKARLGTMPVSRGWTMLGWATEPTKIKTKSGVR